eukprot:scaffold51231_cov30-Tisochrysis_lutea.AAC.3
MEEQGSFRELESGPLSLGGRAFHVSFKDRTCAPMHSSHQRIAAGLGGFSTPICLRNCASSMRLFTCERQRGIQDAGGRGTPSLRQGRGWAARQHQRKPETCRCRMTELEWARMRQIGRMARKAAGRVARHGRRAIVALTVGTQDAIASRTTNPRVSDSEGITKTSAAAYARESASPRMSPVKTTGMPSKVLRRSASAGPPPTMAKRASGRASSTDLIIWMFFSAPSRPT